MADVPVGTAPLRTRAVRPAAFSGLGAYVRSTHVALIIAAVGCPLIDIAEQPSPAAAVSAVLVATIAILGGTALLAETRPDTPFSQWRAGHVVRIAGDSALVLACSALVAVLPGHSGAVSTAAISGALGLRVIAAGAFWSGAARLLTGGIACALGALLLSQVVGTQWSPMTVVVAGLLAFGIIGQDSMYALALELDDLRSVEAERAIADERRRFAGDLHDIQGQHLQLLGVKAHLVRRLIDAGRHEEAGRHATQLQEVATTALEEMRGLVHGYRPVSAEVEAGNAVRVLESAGIHVSARISQLPDDIPDQVDRLLGLAIREGITNILRHTRTRSCRLLIHAAIRDGNEGIAMMIENTGPAATSSLHTTGDGLVVLARRCAQLGGRLEFVPTEEGGGQLAAWLPTDRSQS